MIPGQLAMAVFTSQINLVSRRTAFVLYNQDAFSWNERGQPAKLATEGRGSIDPVCGFRRW